MALLTTRTDTMLGSVGARVGVGVGVGLGVGNNIEAWLLPHVAVANMLVWLLARLGVKPQHWGWQS